MGTQISFDSNICMYVGEGNGTPLQYSCVENPMDGGAWKAAVHGVTERRTRLSDFTFTFHFHALEKEMATHSIVLVWRIPGMGEPGGLPSMGSHRVRHDWSDLAAAAAGSSKKQENSRKTISALLTMPKPLTVWITINFGKFWKTWDYQTTWPASWETCMQVRKQQSQLDMEQQTGSK